MYRIAQWLKRHFPFIWDIIEDFNSLLFGIRYGKRLRNIKGILAGCQEDYVVRVADLGDVVRIVAFFKEQPAEAFTFFDPHPFDERTIRKLIKRASHLIFIVFKDDTMVGYFFLRCFANGKCFRGKLVDYRWRNRGIGKLMGRASTKIAQGIGIRLFGTISKENISSMASSSAVNELKIIGELPNGYLYIEYLPKE